MPGRESAAGPVLEQEADANQSPAAASSPPAPQRTFRWGTLFGALVRIIVALAIIAGAALFAKQMIDNREQPPQREAFERSFTVETIPPAYGLFAPVVSTFGEIVAEQVINVRAPVSGKIAIVSDNLRAGGLVRAGEIIVQVDRFDYESAVADALSALEDARLALREAQEQLRISNLNVDFAASSLELATADLSRARALFDAGSLTSQQLEARELVVSQREQTLAQAKSSLALLDTTVRRRAAAILTAERKVETAQRTLNETTIIAPFDAVVVSNTAVPGAIVSQNEVVASFYDANALEARFTLSEQQFGLLVSDGLIGRTLEVIWDIEPDPVVVTGTVARIGAQVNASLGGIELFAHLDDVAATPLRPGTFVAISLSGKEFENALSIPETALYGDGNFYVIVEGRMVGVKAQVLARDGEAVIVRADVNEGTPIITTRLAQAGEGVRVKLEGEEDERPDSPRGEDRSGNSPPAPSTGD